MTQPKTDVVARQRLPRFARNDIHPRVIARSASDMAISVGRQDSEIATPSARNDMRRRAQNDKRLFSSWRF